MITFAECLMGQTENGDRAEQRSEKLSKPYEYSDASSGAIQRDGNESLRNQHKCEFVTFDRDCSKQLFQNKTTSFVYSNEDVDYNAKEKSVDCRKIFSFDNRLDRQTFTDELHSCRGSSMATSKHNTQYETIDKICDKLSVTIMKVCDIILQTHNGNCIHNSSDGDGIEQNRTNITGKIDESINEFVRTTEIATNMLRTFQTDRLNQDKRDVNAISEVLYTINECYGRLFLLITRPEKSKLLKNIDGEGLDRTKKNYRETNIIRESFADEGEHYNSDLVVSSVVKSIRMRNATDAIPAEALAMITNPTKIIRETNVKKLTTTGLMKCDSSCSSLFDYRDKNRLINSKNHFNNKFDWELESSTKDGKQNDIYPDNNVIDPFIGPKNHSVNSALRHMTRNIINKENIILSNINTPRNYYKIDNQQNLKNIKKINTNKLPNRQLLMELKSKNTFNSIAANQTSKKNDIIRNRDNSKNTQFCRKEPTLKTENTKVFEDTTKKSTNNLSSYYYSNKICFTNKVIIKILLYNNKIFLTIFFTIKETYGTFFFPSIISKIKPNKIEHAEEKKFKFYESMKQDIMGGAWSKRLIDLKKNESRKEFKCID
ncbi:Hypothetical protein CINCED_3A007751 [Cinara cedri]|uniref:Uncharacterized protein n=1 Tax=Cinara cedri TaxID=506608 RepID=A0A5E4NL59_9HEMI|nr:Hypothetical protein CINCED_3A007751 [Cinara cedri]